MKLSNYSFSTTVALFFLFLNFFLPAEIINLPGLTLPEFAPETALKFEMIREEGWNSRGLQYIREIRFDIHGHIESESYLNPDGTEGSRILYYYDSSQALIRREFHHPDARTPDTETYIRDTTGTLLSVSRAYTTGMYGWRFDYSYDDQGRLVLVTKIDRYWKDVIVWEKEFLYDEKGRVTASTGGGMDPNIRWRDEYRYDDNNLLSEKIKYDVDGDLISHTVYERDYTGRINREHQLSLSGEKSGELYYYYRDDQAGNWKEKRVGTVENTGSSRYFLSASWYLRTIIHRPG